MGDGCCQWAQGQRRTPLFRANLLASRSPTSHTLHSSTAYCSRQLYCIIHSITPISLEPSVDRGISLKTGPAAHLHVHKPTAANMSVIITPQHTYSPLLSHPVQRAQDIPADIRGQDVRLLLYLRLASRSAEVSLLQAWHWSQQRLCQDSCAGLSRIRSAKTVRFYNTPQEACDAYGTRDPELKALPLLHQPDMVPPEQAAEAAAYAVGEELLPSFPPPEYTR
ncbi:hypothetical protein MRB53_039047 [Persea americana]|nr:hypothetical protein MRB53_039047 [Persea americana]